MSRTASFVRLAVVIVLITALGLLGIYGLQVGRYDILPLEKAIRQGLDLQGGVYAVYEAEDPGQADLSSKIGRAIEIMRNRLDKENYTEATLSRQGNDNNRIRVEIPNVQDPDEVFDLIGQPAVLEFKGPDGNVIMTGEQIKNAAQGTGENGQIVVNFQLDDTGTSKFGAATSRLVGQPIHIVLDGVTISSPRVNTPITGGQGYIEGGFTVGEAQRLALQLQSGAIPVKLKQLEARTISATLGVDALRTSVIAGGIGLLLVALYMIGFYRLPGFLSGISLIVFTLLTVYVLAITGLQVTLPGVAGIILSIGMAVDANVLIFERMKDELQLGKTLRSAVDGGFKKAFVTILDSNVTTALAGAVLYFFGTGPIKGFAVTMVLGIIISMFTAIVFTRYLMNLLIRMNVTATWLYSYKWKKLEAEK